MVHLQQGHMGNAMNLLPQRNARIASIRIGVKRKAHLHEVLLLCGFALKQTHHRKREYSL